jgi:hypothetical protein
MSTATGINSRFSALHERGEMSRCCVRCTHSWLAAGKNMEETRGQLSTVSSTNERLSALRDSRAEPRAPRREPRWSAPHTRASRACAASCAFT